MPARNRVTKRKGKAASESTEPPAGRQDTDHVRITASCGAGISTPGKDPSRAEDPLRTGMTDGGRDQPAGPAAGADGPHCAQERRDVAAVRPRTSTSPPAVSGPGRLGDPSARTTPPRTTPDMHPVRFASGRSSSQAECAHVSTEFSP